MSTSELRDDMGTDALTLSEAAQELGVHYMTAYRYVRTGRLPAARLAAGWLVERADLGLVRKGPSAAAGLRPRARPGQTPQARLEARLVAGDEPGAWAVVESALASGMGPDSLLLEHLAPAMRSVGERWAGGHLSVADEHVATTVANRVIGRLGARFARRGVRRGTVVIAAPAGETHSLPVAMGANLLRWKGFEVIELGADTPPDALAAALPKQGGLLAVGLVCTTAASCQDAAEAIAAVRQSAPETPVLLGGAAISGADHARQLGAGLFTGKRGDGLVRAVEALSRAGRAT